MARCTVERLMGANGWHGVRRVSKVRTTVPDPAATRAPDLVDPQFRVSAPSRLVVADFTYVRLASGAFAYTAFAIDAFAGRILGWECSTSTQTRFAESAIRQAAAFRDSSRFTRHRIIRTLADSARQLEGRVGLVGSGRGSREGRGPRR